MDVLQAEDFFGPGTIKLMMELATNTFNDNRSTRRRELDREDRMIEAEIENAKAHGETITVVEAMRRAGLEIDDGMLQAWEEADNVEAVKTVK